MKPVNIPILKDDKETKVIQRKTGFHDQRFTIKGQNSKRLKIVQSVTAGHVRGGHSFH